MNIDEMITRLQQAYGDYNPAQGAIVKSWLKSYYADLGILYAEILKTVSWKYKIPPGPAELEECKKAIFKAGLEASRPELQEHKPLQIDEDYVTGEKAAQMLADALGPLAEKMNIRKLYD